MPTRLAAGLSRLLSTRSRVVALSSPTIREICAKISARAAASPKKNPATEMTISSNGAIEKSV